MKVTGTRRNLQDAADELFDDYKLAAAEIGHLIDSDGFIVGKNAGSGRDAWNAARTVAWSGVIDPDEDDDVTEVYIELGDLSRLRGRGNEVSLRARYGLRDAARRNIRAIER